MNFLNKIIAALKAHPGRQAFCIQDTFYTYSQLFSRVASIQSKINENCPGEQNVGIVINDDIETYASILALLFLGKTYIPVHPGYPSDRVGQILEQGSIKYLLSKKEVAYNGAETIVTGGYTPGSGIAPVPPEFAFGNTNAYILFTSGSTGVPKGVPITYHNLDSFVSAFDALGYGATEQDRFLQMFELTFDLSVMSYLVPLCHGACVYTIPDNGMKFMSIYNVLVKHNITFALMVPSVLANLRPYFEEIDLQDMRVSLFCGEALYKDVVTEWMACVPNARVENVYGPTEATIFCLTYQINPGQITDYNGIVAIGAPMAGMGAILADEHNKQLPDGERGELCLHGDQLTPGYLDPEKTKLAFFEVDGIRYYRTGDISFRNEAGDFIYCGRVDHQVKIQGFRVELSEVEFHLRAITGSSNVVALATSNANGLTQIDVIFEGEKADTEPVMDALKTKVPTYMLPAQIHFVTTFPLNTSGKTDRKALQKMIVQTI